MTQIVRMLEGYGFQVFSDRLLVGGMDYAAQLQQAIRTSRAFVLLVSPHSVNSQQVLNELNAAVTTHRRVIPVKIAPTLLTPSFSYHIGGKQIVDYTNPTASWQGEDLVEAILRHDRPPPPPIIKLLAMAVVVVGLVVMLGGFVGMLIAGTEHMAGPLDPSDPPITSVVMPYMFVFLAGMVIAAIGEAVRRGTQRW